MELTKEIVLDKVEFVGPWKTIQERLKTIIREGEVVISSQINRKIYPITEYTSVTELPERLHPYAYGVLTEELFMASQQKEAGFIEQWEEMQETED